MAARRMSFKQLLAPMEPGRFMAEFNAVRPLHIEGPSRKFEQVCSWETLSALLDATSVWTADRLRLVREHAVIPEVEYCRPATDAGIGGVMRPVPQRVSALLQQGATVNLNGIERLHPNISAVATLLAMVYAAPVNCNLYASRKEVVAFPSHFDTSDVFVLHVAGKKRWHVYEQPFEAPAYVNGATSAAFPQAYHETHKGAVLMAPVLTPGDLLYIPAGYYHDALAESEATLHVTFGIDHVRGLVLSDILPSMLAAEPLFRSPLPSPDDPVAHDAYMAKLAGRLAELLTAPEVTAHLRGRQKNQAFWDLPGFALPAPELDQLFRHRHVGRVLERRGGARVLRFGSVEQPVPQAQTKALEWILERDYFETEELMRGCKGTPRETILAALQFVVGVGLVEAIDQYID